MFKDYSDKKCCLTCDGFCFWDGDYCCFPNMKIHQYGWPHQIWFDRDIDKTMQTPETCKDYTYRHHERYPESENEFKKEYKKFKEWDKLCYQLEQHVSDPFGIYKNIIKPKYFSNIEDFLRNKYDRLSNFEKKNTF